MIFGAIFDWDGVIIDSSRHHEKGWEMLAAEEGRTLPPDHFKKGFGRKNEWIIPNLLGWTTDIADIRRLSLRKEALYREALIEDGVTLLDGVVGFLTMLECHHVPCVIGSSSHRENIETVMRQTGLGRFFKGMITSEDVTRGKPDPQVFLLAAEQTGIEPARCVVFEDVPAGIAAASAGGMKAVAVTTTHPARELASADLITDRLDRLSFDDLARLFYSGTQPQEQP